MHVLMTGATGFIGRALVLRLLRDGHCVNALVRSPEKARGMLGREPQVFNIKDEKSLQGAVDRADAIVNLAGAPIFGRRWTKRYRAELVDSRVGVTRRLTDAVQRSLTPPAAFVSASAVGFYGDGGDAELDEEATRGDDFLARLCADWEAVARGAERANTRVAIARIGVVLGTGGGALGSMLPVFRAGLGGPIGSGDQYMAWIHLTDVIEVLARAVADPRYSGVINAVAPQPVTNAAFTRVLARALGRRARLRVPARLVRLGLGGAAAAVLASQRARPRALERLGYAFCHPQLSDALSAALQPGHPTCIRRLDRHDGELLATRSESLRQLRPAYLLEHEEVVEAPLREVLAFFARAENLGPMTPPSLSFEIRTPTPIEMRAGAQIDYRIRLGRLPMRWRTVIEQWRPGRGFVDVQRRGPYRCWWHEHEFTALSDGRTLMRDRVWYAPPLGAVGRIAHRLFIAQQLRDIFAFRAAAIARRFGASASLSADAVAERVTRRVLARSAAAR